MSNIWVPNTGINNDANQTSFVAKDTASNSTMDNMGNMQSASSSTQSFNIYGLLSQSLVELERVKKDIEQLKKKQNNQDELIKSIKGLSDIARIVILILCVIPIIQVVVCGALIRILGMQDKLNNTLNFTITILFGISFLELIAGFLKVYGLDKRIKELEEKMHSLDNRT